MRRSLTMDSFYRFYKGRQVTRCVMAAVAFMFLVAASYSPPPRSVNPVERRGVLRVVTLEGPATYTKGTRGTEGPEFRLAPTTAGAQLGARSRCPTK